MNLDPITGELKIYTNDSDTYGWFSIIVEAF